MPSCSLTRTSLISSPGDGNSIGEMVPPMLSVRPLSASERSRLRRALSASKRVKNSVRMATNRMPSVSSV
ncbi:hypothetical protein D3C78_1568430 [compost metagenome]